MYRYFFILLFFSLSIVAQGPNKLAKSDRSLWPHKITSPAAFDFASQMEMLAFINVFNGYDSLKSETQLKKFLGLKRVAPQSVASWKQSMKKLFVINFNNCLFKDSTNFLTITLPATWESILASATGLSHTLPKKYEPWYQNTQEFYKLYLYEQMRLAALFPRITSEILTLDPTEVQGTKFKDKEYLLTLDDGPSRKGGNTDRLIKILDRENIPGYFFVLGRKLNSRLKSSNPLAVKTLYGNHTVGSHGYKHNPHPRYKAWKSSLFLTDSLITSTFGYNSAHFRPPYGQRNRKIVDYLHKTECDVILWNIDSQDWSSKISSDEITDRVETLMLLWRRGVLLFHDIHPKVATVLPELQKRLTGGEIKWVDPKKLTR